MYSQQNLNSENSAEVFFFLFRLLSDVFLETKGVTLKHKRTFSELVFYSCGFSLSFVHSSAERMRASIPRGMKEEEK